MSLNAFDLEGNTTSASPFLAEPNVFTMLTRCWSVDKSSQAPYAPASAHPASPAAMLDATSPFMDTPFLDEGATPCLPLMANIYQEADTPYYSPFADITLTPSNDIFIANYMASSDSSMAPWCNDEPASFNGDPAQLLIDKTKYEEEQAKHNPLFGPIPSSQVTENDSTSQLEHFSTELPAWNFFPEFDVIDPPSQVSISAQTCSQGVSTCGDDVEDMTEVDELNKSDQESEMDAELSSEEEEEQYERPIRRSKRSKGVKNSTASKRQVKAAKVPEKKTLPCPICSRCFSRRYNLNSHILTHNANRQKAFKCNACKSSFDRKHDRDRHISTVHYGKRIYECHNCSSSFSRRDALVRHSVKMHDDE